jgi:hypothetical protein
VPPTPSSRTEKSHNPLALNTGLNEPRKARNSAHDKKITRHRCSDPGWRVPGKDPFIGPGSGLAEDPFCSSRPKANCSVNLAIRPYALPPFPVTYLPVLPFCCAQQTGMYMDRLEATVLLFYRTQM